MTDRTALIVFADGEGREPIPFGDEEHTETYDERVERLKTEIESCGRGRLGPDEIRAELESFRESTTPEEFNDRTCHDCGVEMGEFHRTGCDWEECPKCGDQYISCGCETEEKKEIWGDD